MDHVENSEAAYYWLSERLAHGDGLPDLILLDLRLPGESGFEVIKKFKSTPKLSEILLVVYSGSNDVSDIALTRRMGADWYFSKDESLKELEYTLKTLDSLSLRNNLSFASKAKGPRG